MAHTTQRSFLLALLLCTLGLAIGFTWLATGGASELPVPAAASAAPAAAPGSAADARPGSLAERTDSERPRGCWSAPAGSRFVHRIVDRCDFEIRAKDGGAQPAGALHSECDVESIVLDRRHGDALVRCSIHNLRFVGADGKEIANDPIQANFAAAAATPVLLRIGAAGQVLALGFAPGLDGDQRNFLRGTLGLFAFEAPPANGGTWTSQVVDSTGEYDARYEVLAVGGDEVGVRRTRLRYTAVAGHDEVPEHDLRGAAEARFRVDLGWLASAHLDEGMTLVLPLLEIRVVTARRADVSLLEHGTTTIDGDVATAWSTLNAPASGKNEATGGYAADSERRRWEQQLAGVSLEALLADIRRVLAADPVDAEALDGAFQKLQWLVKLDDRQATAIAHLLTTRQMGDAEAGVALGALGAAGTPAAQQALLAVRSDPGAAPGVREAATVACLQLDAPSQALIESLSRDASDASPIQGQSMLVLGALAPRARGALADGRSPVDRLLAMETEAAARGDVATWLLAIGNAAPPQTLAIVQRHVVSTDPAVRGAACVALRRVGDAEALPILVERATTDTDASVRRDALLELGRRRAAAARDAVRYVADHDTDEDLRRRAQRLLGAG